MPGTVVIILPCGPEGCAGNGINIAACQSFGKAQLRYCNHALEHPCEGLPHLLAGRANWQCAGDIGGAILILRAAVDQQKAVTIQRAVAGLGDPIMHHGPMWARSADGVKADVMQQVGGGAIALKLFYNVNFTKLGRIGAVKPGQKLHHRRAIAQMRRPAAFQLPACLAGFRQATGIQTA